MRPNRSAHMPGLRQPLGKLQRAGQLRLGRAIAPWHLAHQRPRLQLRMLHRLTQAQHRFHTRIHCGEQRAQLIKAALLKLDLQRLLQRWLLIRPQAHRHQIRTPQRVTQWLHERGLQAAHRHPAPIPRAVIVVEAAAIEHVAFPLRFHPTRQVTRAGHGVQAERAVGHAHVQVLADPALLPGDNRRKQPHHRMQRTAAHIRQLHAQRQRPGVLASGVAGHPGQRQVIDIVPGAVLVGPGLAVSGDRHIDQPGVDRLQCLILQPQPLHHPRSELFEHNVVLFHQRPYDLQRLGLLEVQRQATLVAIEVGMAG
ncbi:hypothetical protein ALQ38_05560 [Pseudomonas marginalis pv. marginalis]|nr:hypothetical protein ALQ38_05560 [Pseudomonas marginalis pv. marginalis]